MMIVQKMENAGHTLLSNFGVPLSMQKSDPFHDSLFNT